MKQQIIAEIGSVHDGSLGNACKLIEAAAASGADAVKFQTHIAEAETLRDAPSPGYFAAEPRFDYFRRTGFTPEEWRQLKDHSTESGVAFFSSPFSLEAVDLLEDIGVEAYKIASGEVTNLPLLKHIAETGKPVVLSSGMSDWRELDDAVNTLREGGPLALLQCSSIYPCPPQHVGLNCMVDMAERYSLPVGFSDHTTGMAAAMAAAALGASVIEKHFTFSRLMYGSDAKNSMEPDEFTTFTAGIREVWTILEHPVDKSNVDQYEEMKNIFEKSIVTACPVEAGTTLERQHLAFKKPGDGIGAARYESILGRRTAHDLPGDHKLAQADLL
jgi:N,N'-diacetyllegionaminate synthase